MKVVGYARVSTDEQASEGVSLDAQRGKIEAYAALHGLDLVAVEIDAGVSAKTLKRPGLGRALGMLRDGRADGLLVTKLDRLSRSVKDWNELIDGYFGDRPGKVLMSVSDSIDTRTAAGRLVLNVLMSVAQWEREANVERTREALGFKRTQGERIGTIPYGSKLGPDGRTLLDDVEEREALAELARWKAEGRSLRAMAAGLNALGIPTKSGRPWTHSTIAGIFARQGQGS